MVTPLQAPSALKEARVGLGTGYAAVHAGDGNELTDKSFCIGPGHCVVDIDPDRTRV
jgi:hypothetical protein